MSSIVVSNSDQLAAALRQSQGGGTIYLKAGDYGSLRLSAYAPTGLVNIVSSDPHTAHFDDVLVQRSRNIKFTGLDIGSSNHVTPAMGRAAISIGESQNLTFSGLRVTGNGDGDPTNDVMGVRTRYSSAITVENSLFEELHRGVATSFSSGVTIRQNTIKNMAEDGLNFAEVSRVKVSGNYIGEFSKVLPGIHPDAMQFMTHGTQRASSNIEITDNVIYQGDGAVMQGIFMGNEAGIPYDNVMINNNLVYTHQYHGISVGSATNLRVSNNTTLSKSGDLPYSWIMLNKVKSASVYNNVTEDVDVRSSAEVRTSNNFEVSGLPNLVDLFPGLRETLPDIAKLIVVGRGYQMRHFGASEAGTSASLSASEQAPFPSAVVESDSSAVGGFTASSFPSLASQILEVGHWALP